MKMKNAEILSGLIFIVVSIWFLIQAFQLPNSTNSNDVGPGAFPIGIAILLISFSIILIINGIVKKSGLYRMFIKRWKNIMISIGMIFLYGLAIPYIGFYLATVIFFPFLFLLASERNWKTIASVTVLYGAFAFLVFDLFLGVPLP